MASGKTLLVTGASGQLGRRVIEILLEAGETNIIGTTRSPEKLADFAARGVAVRQADFSQPDTLTSAFEGANRILIISTDALDVRTQQQTDAVAAAVKAGVEHIVYTSVLAADELSGMLAESHLATENAIKNAGIGYTILRNSIYSEMLVYGLAQAKDMGGQVFSAKGDGKLAYVTREDCAQAAAAALAADFDRQRILNVTGPEALTMAEVAALGSEVSGQTFTHVALPKEALVDGMVQAGLPQPVADVYAGLDVATAEGKFDIVTNVVEDLSGNAPQTVAAVLAENAAAFS